MGLDFLMVAVRQNKRGFEIYPKFIIKPSECLMIRGGDFYAVWVEERKLWSTNEQDALELIDRELDDFARRNGSSYQNGYRVLHMWDAESGMIDVWHKYCQRQMRDSFHMLDEKLIFSNQETKRTDYASKKLPYPLEEGETPAWDRLMSIIYKPEERRKIEWAIGSIVTGDSVKLQKFMVLYGAAGTGKSTVLNIIQQLFEGYVSVFDAKALGSSSNAFALEAFHNNPLVAIQHDGDLSKIEDNTRLNSLVSHELMTVNEKFKSTYANRFKCFLFMGTNRPVRITDAKSGLMRRLIDVTPSGDKLSPVDYRATMKQISFELGRIATHCKEVYLEDPSAYDDYVPVAMMGASNDFYNFIIDSWPVFVKQDETTLKAAWEMYKTYCADAQVAYPYSQRAFKEELKNYFREYSERELLNDGQRVRNYYKGFKTDMFESSKSNGSENGWLTLSEQDSIFDKQFMDSPAQYAKDDETPRQAWDKVKTVLADIDTSKLHYVRPPLNLIVIDFDIPDSKGNKDAKLNIAEASKWPPTYAELSKGGSGVHLHYFYSGDVTKLSCIYSDHIEIKVFTGKSSLRRRLSKCNDLQIATLTHGLPLKEERKTLDAATLQNERQIRNLILRNLAKEIHPNTKPSVDFIRKILDEAYNSDLSYDVSDMENAIYGFALKSTHQADACLKQVKQMHFRSKDKEPKPEESIQNDPLVFFDVEVFPNLFLVNYKVEGEGKPVIRLINPSPAEIERILDYKLVGFNCRRYDNHILYACFMGCSNEQLFKISQRIVGGDRTAFFGEAYDISYTDVYDFSSKKQSLKKFEIELGIHHQELGIPWDKPVPEEDWEKVAKYCDNDVLATEAVFNARKADFVAREILADVAGMKVNDTTNSLTTRIIFGNNRTPQSQFNYRFMGEYNPGETYTTFPGTDPEYTLFNGAKPIFPGYTFQNGKSTYRGEEVGEGGYVYSEPGMYRNVALLDIASMHPSSIVAEQLFGPNYTARFKEILDARIAIKHKEFDRAGQMLGGKLAKYLTDEKAAKDLAQALKIAINSVYGLTAAKFENPFHDNRNVDNIVAKRGALFMVNLKHEVLARGFTVAHIKTDSIKIPEATPEIIQFVMDYGKLYGYNFEHEATYDRMCLVNDAVYIAKYNSGEWTATGTQFAVPYVFKTLFSHEPILFEDMCETKSVTSALYLDMNEGGEHDYHFIGKVGCFCPVQNGAGGGELVRDAGNSKFASATGAKGYRWLESETVRQMGFEDRIDLSYYQRLVDEAKDTISKYGDFEGFVA